MYTANIHNWVSLYDPYWFSMVGIHKCADHRNCQVAPDITYLFAYMDWRVTMFCQFDFSSFPLDIQRCEFRQLTTSPIVLFVLNPQKNALDSKDRAKGFEVTKVQFGTFITPNDSTQEATKNIGFNITLQRVIQPYLYQYYFPSIAIVVVSYISFIIPLSAIPSRISLVVTLLLTLSNLFIHQMVSRKYEQACFYF